MSDRIYFATALLAAMLLVALSFVWPQGAGRTSPGPFGGPEILTPAAKADLANAAKAAAKKAAAATVAPGAKK